MQKDGERKISASDHRLYCYSGISPIANTKILLTKNVKALQISSLVELKSSIIMAKTTKNVRKYFFPLFYQIKIRGKKCELYFTFWLKYYLIKKSGYCQTQELKCILHELQKNFDRCASNTEARTTNIRALRKCLSCLYG